MSLAADAHIVDLDKALDFVEKHKSGILPPFLKRTELDELLEAWHQLFNDPAVQLANNRFIVDHKLYRQKAFARLATHPVVQDVVRRVIGDFKLASYSVVATPRNGERPTPRLHDNKFHVDHVVYSDVPVETTRDTFVCVWCNFEQLTIENGPFAVLIDTDKWAIGWDFFKSRPGLSVADMDWQDRMALTVGPPGTTAVYSGKTWHSATTNASDMVRKGLNMNFVPAKPLDTLKRNTFDVCALTKREYDDLARLIGIPEYMIDHDPAMQARTHAAVL